MLLLGHNAILLLRGEMTVSADLRDSPQKTFARIAQTAIKSPGSRNLLSRGMQFFSVLNTDGQLARERDPPSGTRRHLRRLRRRPVVCVLSCIALVSLSLSLYIYIYIYIGSMYCAAAKHAILRATHERPEIHIAAEKCHSDDLFLPFGNSDDL